MAQAWYVLHVVVARLADCTWSWCAVAPGSLVSHNRAEKATWDLQSFAMQQQKERDPYKASQLYCDRRWKRAHWLPTHNTLHMPVNRRMHTLTLSSITQDTTAQQTGQILPTDHNRHLQLTN